MGLSLWKLEGVHNHFFLQLNEKMWVLFQIKNSRKVNKHETIVTLHTRESHVFTPFNWCVISVIIFPLQLKLLLQRSVYCFYIFWMPCHGFTRKA